MKTFVELGSSYFDTLHEKLGSQPEAWAGVTVDARQEFLDKLPKRKNVVTLNALIVPGDEPVTPPQDFFFVPHNLVVYRGLPQWLDGCGSINRDHAILRLFSDEAVQKVQTETLSIGELFRRLGDTPDLIKLDLEGGDYAIVSSMLELDLLPKSSLEFEVVHMAAPHRTELTERLASKGFVFQSEYGDSATFAKKARSLWIYADTSWAFGSIHTGLAEALTKRGWTVKMDMLAGSPEQFEQLCVEAAGFDCVLGVLDGNSQYLRDVGHVSIEKTFLVSHAHFEIQAWRQHSGMDGYGGYGVVSDALASTSIQSGVSLVPTILPLGVRSDHFDRPLPTRLAKVGFGSILSRTNEFGVECKRGDLAKRCAEAAGLEFVSAFEPHGSGGERVWNTRDQMPDFYASVDCVLMPSLQEGAGLPPLEAAAAGRLAIGTPVGHWPRIVSEGIGILAPLGEQEFFDFTVERLKFYRDNPKDFVKKCGEGQRNARAHRDWSVVVDVWERFLGA